jgi:hypothetical protein
VRRRRADHCRACGAPARLFPARSTRTLGPHNLQMDILLVALWSPVVASAAIVLVALITLIFGDPERSLRFLFARAGFYALVAAAFSLGLTIISMIWYEHSTGYSAGNGPLGWIFIYGPLSAAIGEIIALIHWWVRKPQTEMTLRERT